MAVTSASGRAGKGDNDGMARGGGWAAGKHTPGLKQSAFRRARAGSAGRRAGGLCRPEDSVSAQGPEEPAGAQSYLMYLKRGSSGVPSSAASGSRPGCQSTTSSILRASAKSFSVMPLALWVASFTVTKA